MSRLGSEHIQTRRVKSDILVSLSRYFLHQFASKQTGTGTVCKYATCSPQKLGLPDFSVSPLYLRSAGSHHLATDQRQPRRAGPRLHACCQLSPASPRVAQAHSDALRASKFPVGRSAVQPAMSQNPAHPSLRFMTPSLRLSRNVPRGPSTWRVSASPRPQLRSWWCSLASRFGRRQPLCCCAPATTS